MANHLAPKVEVPQTTEEVQQILNKAQKGDTTTLPVLRLLFEKPEIVELLGGNLAEHVENSFLAALSGQNLALREGVKRKLELLRQDLSGPNPSSLEKLLVDRVVACWLQVHDADVRYAQRGDCTLAQADFYQRRMNHSHKRYLSAIKTLATVRRLAIPVLIGQINIADRQKNTVNIQP